jgi:hypothetical protein
MVMLLVVVPLLLLPSMPAILHSFFGVNEGQEGENDFIF